MNSAYLQNHQPVLDSAEIRLATVDENPEIGGRNSEDLKNHNDRQLLQYWNWGPVTVGVQSAYDNTPGIAVFPYR